MTRQEKKDIVSTLAERFSSASYFYIVDAQGLNLDQVNDFRKRCFRAGVTYQVVKNTLIRKALEQVGGAVDYNSFNTKVLKGFSGILFPQETASLPAKLIQEFRKQRNLTSPLFKGAYIDTDFFIGEEHLQTLSRLKSKHELIGDVIGLLQSPIARLMSSLQSGKHQIAGLVETLADRK